MRKLLIFVFAATMAFGQVKGKITLQGNVAVGPGTLNSCGPPNYACANVSTSIINLVNPIPNVGPNTCDSTSIDTLSTCGNLTGINTVITPTDFNQRIVRCTDSTSNAVANIWLTADSGDPELWNLDDTAFLAGISGSSHRYVIKFNPATFQCSVDTALTTDSQSAFWSHTANNVVYQINGSKIQTVTFNFAAHSRIVADVFDFASTGCLGTSYVPTWNGFFGDSNDDTVFSVGFSNTGGQGTGCHNTSYNPAHPGCSVFNSCTGDVSNNGTSIGTIALPERWNLHEVTQTDSPSFALSAPGANGMIVGEYIDGGFSWQVNTTSILQCGLTGTAGWATGVPYAQWFHVNPALGVNAGNYVYQAQNAGTTGGSQPTWPQTVGQTVNDNGIVWKNEGKEYFCDGHSAKGSSGKATGKKATYHLYSDPTNPLTQFYPTGSTGFDWHGSWNNTNAADTFPLFGVGSDVGTTVNLLGTLPSVGFDELFAIKTDGSGTFLRFAHTYNTGYHAQFVVQNAIGVVSGSGRYMAWASDWMCTLGATTGAATNICGGPDWNKNTVYATNFKIAPLVGNAGNYVFQATVGGTSGSGSHPTWPQTVGNTVSDNGITWTNIGAENSRSDIFVVELK